MKKHRKIDNNLLTNVARIYSLAAEKGMQPIKTIMFFYDCPHRTAQDYATIARQLNYLPKTTSGKVTV